MPILRSKLLPVQHPGVVFKLYYLDRYNISLTDAAKTLGIKAFHLNCFINGKANVTSTLATKLERTTGISSAFWLNLQKTHNFHRL